MSTLTPADVTVVVPARNAAATVGATLASLVAGPCPPRVVVVDDGSTDGTAAAALAAWPSTTVLHTGGVGPGPARNLGVDSVRTALVAFCDADDLWPPDRLVDDLALFAQRPALDAVVGRTRFDADDPALLAGMHFDGDDSSAVIPHFGTVTVRREVFRRTGPIASTANYEDYDWFLRLREVGAAVLVHDRVVLWRRMHHTSTSQQHPATPHDLLAMLRTSVDRRRAAGVGAIPRLADLRDPDARRGR